MTHESLPSMDDDRALDLLVDGELTPTHRRELLLRLENTPGGWRRCALAFLEAQTWGRELGLLAHEPPVAAALPAAAPMASAPQAASKMKSGRGVWANLFAVAASFAIAFGLGSWYRGPNRGADLAGTLGGSVASSGKPKPIEVSIDDPALQKWIGPDGCVTLALDGVVDGESQEVRVPVLGGEEQLTQEFIDQPLELPPELLAEFARAGHTVRGHRQFVPFQLGDGRSMIVPMDEVEIVPVNRVFQ
jgi:hypothetical protein